MNILKHILFFVWVFALSSCLEDKVVQSSEANENGSSWFEGVKSVKNLGGFPPGVLIEWNEATLPVNGYIVYALIRDSKTGINTWTNVSDVVPAGTTSYLHSATDQVIPGQIISYKVKALDLTSAEDTNNRQISTVIFDGLQDIRITGKTTAIASLSSAVGSFDEVRIYAEPTRSGGVKKLVATAVGNVLTVPITNLRSGVKYKFSAQAFMRSTNSEDGNQIYREGQTYSDSFGSGATNDTSYYFQNVRLVQSFGDAPNMDPVIGPTQRVINITFNPFLNSTPDTKYRIVRAEGSQAVIDMTTTKNCTATENSSCIVCTVSGFGPQTCTDTNLDAPPKKYKYAVSLIKKDTGLNEEWIEELPTTNQSDFTFVSWVAPSYMVQVNRESSNYEMCYQLKKYSDPRKKNRCIYAGIGATPYNTNPGRAPLSFDSGYYDFGYNLFVDRNKLGCNWTRTPGACGSTDGCIGKVFSDPDNDNVPNGQGTPSNLIGVDGNVYLGINDDGPSCFVKVSGIWRDVGAAGTSLQALANVATADPGPIGLQHRPTIDIRSVEGAQQLCNAQASEYGSKRIMRRREWIVSSPLPYLQGEPGAFTTLYNRWYTQLGTLSNKGQSDADQVWGCASTYQGESNLLSRASVASPSNLSLYLDPGNKRAQLLLGGWGTHHFYYSDRYFIGSPATRNCKSRFGLQNPMGEGFNRGTILSDQFIKMTSVKPVVFQGDTSDVDDGARDFVGFQLNSTTQGGTLNESTSNIFYYGAATSGTVQAFPFFLPTLGIPLMNISGTQNGTNYQEFLLSGELSPSFAGIGLTSSAGQAYFPHYNSTTARQTMTSGYHSRFSLLIWVPSFGQTVRCAVSPE